MPCAMILRAKIKARAPSYGTRLIRCPIGFVQPNSIGSNLTFSLLQAFLPKGAFDRIPLRFLRGRRMSALPHGVSGAVPQSVGRLVALRDPEWIAAQCRTGRCSWRNERRDRIARRNYGRIQGNWNCNPAVKRAFF
jgi:hypothetical protein